RINRRFFIAQLFDRLLCACSSTTTITYKQLISETS
ncbi:MAG: IS1595 family transposase, partial [Treponema sp.]|nr:IS1595 family transposase [Treponema sp.]